MTSDMTPTEIFLTQADIESLDSFSNVIATGADQRERPISVIKLEIFPDRWEVRGTDRYVAVRMASTHAAPITAPEDGLAVYLDRDKLSLLKKRLVTAKPAQRGQSSVAIKFTDSERAGTVDAQISGTTVEDDFTTTFPTDVDYPAIDRLFPTEFEEAEHILFDFKKLEQIAKVVMPHEVGTSKSKRCGAVRIDHGKAKTSGNRINRVRKAAENDWPDGLRFEAIIMSLRDFGFALSDG